MKAIFLDRDGTINKDPGYFHDHEDIHYFDDVKNSLKELSHMGFELFIVTNQSGVGRGIFSEECIHLIHERMQQDFAPMGFQIKDLAYCPHAPEDNCDCRKPRPKMLLQLAQKWEINLQESFMLGDKISDIECAENAKVQGILINTRNIDPKGKTSFQSLSDFVLYLKN